MPVVGTPISGVAGLSYLTSGEGDALAATLPAAQVSAYVASSERQALLVQATADVDNAGPWQGRKYDPSTQTLQFPRVAQESTLRNQQLAGAITGWDSIIWDFDTATNTAIVPPDVKRAVLLQANALAAGRGSSQDAQHDGLLEQSVGPMDEKYRAAQGPYGVPTLCRAAAELMRKYQLRGGRIL